MNAKWGQPMVENIVTRKKIYAYTEINFSVHAKNLAVA